MGARRFSPTLTCRARWAGSPAFIRCGLIRGRSMLRRRWRAAPALGRALKLIKEQLHAVPDHGLGYGLLRYLNPQTAAQLRGLARPQLGFNYLGRFAAAGGGGLGERWRGGCAWRRRRSGDAACACAGGQCADARWPRRAPR